MGTEYVRFRCHRCLHCCTEVIALPTPWDVIQIIRATGLRPTCFLEFLNPDEISGVEADEPVWLDCMGARFIMALRRDPEKGCHFLHKDDKRCSIYEDRPLLCRLFPFKALETEAGDWRGFTLHGAADVECPRNRDGRAATGPLYDLYLQNSEHTDDYEALVQVFNGREYEGKCPEDFIGMFFEEKLN